MVAKTKYVGVLAAATGALAAVGLLLLMMLGDTAKATLPSPVPGEPLQNGKIVYSGHDGNDWEIYKISSTTTRTDTGALVFDTPVQLTNNKTDDLACLLTMGNFATGFMSAAKLLLSPSSSVQAAFFSAG